VRLGESRSILRRALKGLVPDAVLQRRTKAGPSGAFMRALNRQRHWVTSLLRDPRVCAHGIVDRAALHSAVHRATHGDPSAQPLVIRCISLELWLRTLEERYFVSGATAPPGWRERQRQENTDGTPRQQHGGTTRVVRSA
jgi:asparagine synthetase B (glutamine-hydrolysing)